MRMMNGELFWIVLIILWPDQKGDLNSDDGSWFNLLSNSCDREQKVPVKKGNVFAIIMAD
jgi:hypothetical protein